MEYEKGKETDRHKDTQDTRIKRKMNENLPKKGFGKIEKIKPELGLAGEHHLHQDIQQIFAHLKQEQIVLNIAQICGF